MQKSFDITIDDQQPINPSNSFAIYRGDNVAFNFTFQRGGISLDVDGATLRVFAKKIGKNGAVDKLSLPLFAEDFVATNTATFNSSQTCGDAGNYILSVLLVSSDDAVITSQCIYFELKENGYAGEYQPSADFRDEVFNASALAQQSSESAQASAINAQQSESNASASEQIAQQSATSARTSEANANLYSIEASNSSIVALQSKEQTEQFLNETIVAKNEAILAKEQAQEISDPENRIVNLQQTKINRGEIFLQDGKIEASQPIEMNGAFSVVWTATRDADVSGGIGETYRKPYVYTGLDTGTQKGLTLTMDDQWAGFYFRWWKSNGSAGRIANTLNVQKYFDGKPHVWLCVFNGTNVKLIVDNSIIANASVDDFAPTTPTNPLTITSPNSTISRVKYFNFDITDANAPYTIADYISGKDESPICKGAMSIKASEITFASASTSSYPSTIECNADDDTITITATADTNNNLLWIRKNYSPSIRIPKGATIEYSFDELTSSLGQAKGLRLYLGASATSSEFFYYGPIVQAGTYRLVATESDIGRLDILPYNENKIQAGTTFTIKGLKIKVNGALLSLDDYTFNGKVFDTSGNNNTATITGAVKGTKDNAVEQMYQAFASRIGNLTE